jgi:hypothetical protein
MARGASEASQIATPGPYRVAFYGWRNERRGSGRPLAVLDEQSKRQRTYTGCDALRIRDLLLSRVLAGNWPCFTFG